MQIFGGRNIMRTYYKVYWYENLSLKKIENFTTFRAAELKYDELIEKYLFVGLEKIKEEIRLLQYTQYGEEQIKVSA